MPQIATWNNYGGLYVEDGSTAETTVDATPRIVEAFTTAMSTGSEATSSTTAGTVTITDAGDYRVDTQFSFSGSLSKTYEVEVYVDGVGTGIKCERLLGTGGDVGSASVSGIVSLTAGQVVSLYQSSTDGGTTITISNAQLVVNGLS